MKYIKKIIIDNFQSHEHTEIDFTLGLNIIVGQSDKGKSAILRALKWVLYNEPRGSDFIRHGTNECSVTILTEDNYTVTRRRKSNKNIYIVINPEGEKQEFENFGNDVPSEVFAATGIKIIKLDTDTESKLNLYEQLEPPFLLSETGSLRAKAIGRIVNTNIIDAAERDLLKDIANNNQTIKAIDKQIQDIGQELLGYADIDKEERRIQELENKYEKLSKSNMKLEKLVELKDKLTSIDASIIENNEILAGLKELPCLTDWYNILKEKYNFYLALINKKNKLHNINQDIIGDKRVLATVKDIDTAYNKVKLMEAKSSSIIKLSELSAKKNEVLSNIQKGKEYMNGLLKTYDNSIKEYGNILKQLGKCPTCFCSIDDSTINHIIHELEGEINANN